MIRAKLLLWALTGLALSFQSVVAADDTGLNLELNSAQETDSGACQITVVLANESGEALDRAAWQVAIFDTQGVVRGLPILDFGALPKGKTKVAVFELPGRPCSEIARIVVNDVADCTLSGGRTSQDLCLTALVARSRTTIAFGL